MLKSYRVSGIVNGAGQTVAADERGGVIACLAEKIGATEVKGDTFQTKRDLPPRIHLSEANCTVEIVKT